MHRFFHHYIHLNTLILFCATAFFTGCSNQTTRAEDQETITSATSTISGVQQDASSSPLAPTSDANFSTVGTPDSNTIPGYVRFFGDPNRQWYSFFDSVTVAMRSESNPTAMAFAVVITSDSNFCSRAAAPMYVNEIVMYGINPLVESSQLPASFAYFITNPHPPEAPTTNISYTSDPNVERIGYKTDCFLCDYYIPNIQYGNLALTVDDDQTVIGDNLAYATIHANISVEKATLTFNLKSSRCAGVSAFVPDPREIHGAHMAISCVRTVPPSSNGS